MRRLHKGARNRHEARMRAFIRNALAWLTLGFISMLLFGVGGEWLIHVAEDKGWYRNAGKNWDRAMAAVAHFFEWLSSVATSTPALMLGSCIGGAAIALWSDRIFAGGAGYTRGKLTTKKEVPTDRLHHSSNDWPTDRLSFLLEELPDKKPEKFNYPYRKAVLIASVEPVVGSADETGLLDITTVISVQNQHSETLENCCVVIDFIGDEEKTTNVDSILIAGQKNYFDLKKGERKKIKFISRDFRDKISKPPYLMKCHRETILFYEKRTYQVHISLVSEYDHSTRACILVKIGVGKDITTEIIDQSV